jgi:hypothetical protein
MLSRFDDYPIHQTPEPIAHPASSDRNVYDRYWFNGYAEDGEFYFGIGAAIYPNRGILDCGFSIVRGGEQHAFHASRRLPQEPTQLEVGPFRIEVVDPMRRLRVVLAPNETGIECDLIFSARTAAVQEGRQTLRRGERVVMDVTRFAQFGRWQGRIRSAGRDLAVDAARVAGTKDRSWGIRPLGEPETGGAPQRVSPQIFFLWAPIHWRDRCTHYGLFEDAEGFMWHRDAAILPVYDSPDAIPGSEDPGERRLAGCEHEIEYVPGTRRARRARIALVEKTGQKHEIELEALLCFRMKGIGYLHPSWGHGVWKGELAIGGESWKSDELDPLAFENQHVQQVVRARMGREQGVGVLEQLCFGPHARYGFKELLDPAR